MLPGREYLWSVAKQVDCQLARKLVKIFRATWLLFCVTIGFYLNEEAKWLPSCFSERRSQKHPEGGRSIFLIDQYHYFRDEDCLPFLRGWGWSCFFTPSLIKINVSLYASNYWKKNKHIQTLPVNRFILLKLHLLQLNLTGWQNVVCFSKCFKVSQVLISDTFIGWISFSITMNWHFYWISIKLSENEEII